VSQRAAPAFEVVPMSEDDLPAVVALDVAAFAPGELGAVPEGDTLASLRDRQLREELARAWSRLRVARDGDGDILGYALWWHVVDELHLLNVAVLPELRRRGVGRALVEDLLAYGVAHAAARVFLEVRASNAPALALYERLGFERFHVRRGYYSDGEDGVEMRFELTSSA